MDALNIFLWQIFIIGLLIFIGLLTLILASHWKIFVKAGKPGWAAIIPFYHGYTFSVIVFGNASYFIASTIITILCNMLLVSESSALFSLIATIRLILHTFFSIKLSMVFGKNAGFMVGMIYLPIIFQAVLGFGDAEYIEPEKDM